MVSVGTRLHKSVSESVLCGGVWWFFFGGGEFFSFVLTLEKVFSI